MYSITCLQILLLSQLQALCAAQHIGAGPLAEEVIAILRYLPRVRTVRGEEPLFVLLMGITHARHPLVEELLADLQVQHIFILMTAAVVYFAKWFSK